MKIVPSSSFISLGIRILLLTLSSVATARLKAGYKVEAGHVFRPVGRGFSWEKVGYNGYDFKLSHDQQSTQAGAPC